MTTALLEQSSLASVSDRLAAIVEQVGASVVAVHGRHRIPSSGAVWQPGVVVTAAHTLKREEGITIVVPSGKVLNAVLAGRDPGTDLAVLKVEGLDLTPVPTGDAQTLKAGHFVVAVGRAENSEASAGIVAAVGPAWRTWHGSQIDRLIRLDGGLYAGFSGGPLADATGKVVGICTAGLMRGTAVVIPVSTVTRVTEELLATGHVSRGYLGVGMQPVALPTSASRKLGLESDGGVLVVSVQSDGPADTAGVLVGDVLLELGTLRVTDVDEVQAAIASTRIGEPIRAMLVRAGERLELSITLGERPRRSH
jgi:serine protease Do